MLKVQLYTLTIAPDKRSIHTTSGGFLLGLQLHLLVEDFAFPAQRSPTYLISRLFNARGENQRAKCSITAARDEHLTIKVFRIGQRYIVFSTSGRA